MWEAAQESRSHERCEIGLCFQCDGKWSRNHVCSWKELHVLMGVEDYESTSKDREGGSLVGGGDGSEGGCEEVGELINISLYSVVGITNPRTMKLQGKIGGEVVIVLIDPGATHNFISTQLVERLKVGSEECKKYQVILGNGEEIVGQGVCKSLKLWVQGLEIEDDFLVLPLGNTDLILGIQWLERLGLLTTNWKTQHMHFMWKNEPVVLVGDVTLRRAKVTLKAIMKEIQVEGEGVLVECK